jgi:ribose transport system substrate-binding protein
MNREEYNVRGWLVVLLGGIITVTTVVTLYYAYEYYAVNKTDVFQSKPAENDKYRLMFIAAEQNAPYWDRVQAKALKEAELGKVSIQFRNVRPNEDEVIKQMEVAIASKVDGIIVQGMDNPQFVQVVNKASEHGIPVITVFTDSPSSLRKAYVGADHSQEGNRMGQAIAKAVHYRGAVSVLYDNTGYNYQNERMNGIEQALSEFPGIEVVKARFDGSSREWAYRQMNDLLNQGKDIQAVIGLSSEAVIGSVQALSSRARLKDYFIAAFDDSPEMISMISTNKIDGVMLHDDGNIGRISVALAIEWLEGQKLPLETYHYVTNRLYTSEEFKHENFTE